MVEEVNMHTHAVTVEAADVEAGTEMEYTLTEAGHTHTITVTAADFAMLQAGDTVTVTSTMDGTTPHAHDVTLMCA
jgi:hypothetical protein